MYIPLAYRAAGLGADVAMIECTMDMRACPDGSMVGRSGSDCDFRCPPVRPGAAVGAGLELGSAGCIPPGVNFIVAPRCPDGSLMPACSSGRSCSTAASSPAPAPGPRVVEFEISPAALLIGAAGLGLAASLLFSR